MLTMGSQRIRHNLATEQQQMLGKKILDMISAFLNVLRLALWLVSLLMSYLDALSIGESGALNFPAIFVLLWISPFHVCLMCRDAPVLGAHILTSFVSPSWIDLTSFDMMSVLVSCSMIYFKVYCFWYEYYYFSFLLLSISMEYLFPSPHFQPVCALHLKLVSCKSLIYGSCSCIHSASLFLLVWACYPFIVKVIISMYALKAILLIDFDLFL